MRLIIALLAFDITSTLFMLVNPHRFGAKNVTSLELITEYFMRYYVLVCAVLFLHLKPFNSFKRMLIFTVVMLAFIGTHYLRISAYQRSLEGVGQARQEFVEDQLLREEVWNKNENAKKSVNDSASGLKENQLHMLKEFIDLGLTEFSDVLTTVVADDIKSHGEQIIPTPPYKSKVPWDDVDLEEVPIPVFAVLVISCKRPTVRRCLKSLNDTRGDRNERFHIIVSQGCNDKATEKAVTEFTTTGLNITMHTYPDSTLKKWAKIKNGYMRISEHYKAAFTHVFDVEKYKAVIVVEDDLIVSVDFFNYFSDLYPLLVEDEKLWCISAWNDHGQTHLVDTRRADLLYRTDFFPGLGWMLTDTTWNELRAKWPTGYWDDWMREPAQRKDRHCIRPEISRTHHFGNTGTSNGQFNDKIKLTVLNEEEMSFGHANRMKILLPEVFDTEFSHMLMLARQIDETADITKLDKSRAYKIVYGGQSDYKRLADRFGMLNDVKAGVPRAAYYGVVNIFYRGVRIFLMPMDYLYHAKVSLTPVTIY